MKTLLLLVTLLLAQQEKRPEFGTIRGRLTTVNGGPAAMVRIALALPDTSDPITTLSNIGQTDAAGLYELTNIPPGRYLIVAGPVNRPTYFPGFAEQARIVTIAAGQVLTDLGFTVDLGASAPGTTVSGGSGTVTGIARIDDSTPLPFTNAPGFFRVGVAGRNALSQLADVRGPLGSFVLQLGPGDNLVTLSPLPLGYYLKSITYGRADLTKAPITLPASSNTTEVEIVLTKVRPDNAPPGVRVTGHVTRGEGALWRTPSLELMNISNGNGWVLYAGTVVLAENDTFSIEHVPPGRYRFGPIPGNVEFQVGANDVTGLTVHLGKPDTVVPLNTNSLKTVQGTIEELGEELPQFEISFIPTRSGGAPHVVKASGKEFSIGIPEGEYRISVSGLPDGYAVESVHAGPLDLTSPFLLTSAGIADRFTGTPVIGKATGASPSGRPVYSSAGTAAGVTIRLKR